MIEDQLLSPEAVADPYGYLEQLRKADPVSWSQRYRSWIISDHASVAEAFKNLSFSSDRIHPVIARERSKQRPDVDLVETLELLNEWLVFRDPPEHTRLRRLVHKAFSPRMIASMRGEVVRVTDELIEQAAERAGTEGVIDFHSEVAYPLPAIVIAGMLGVPPEDRVLFKEWSDDISALVFGALDDQGRHARARRGMAELVRYITELVASVREEPRDNLASALVHAQEVDERLTEPEVIAVCVNLLFGGHETTTNLIANGILAFLTHPEQADLLRSEPERVNAAIEELLRYDGPAKAVARIAGEDFEFRGRTITRGERVFLMLAGANHDPDVFPDPGAFDIRRNQPGHLGFGIGIHYCLGAHLARLEAATVIPRVLEQFPDLALADGPLEWDPVILTRSLRRLPIRLGARRVAG